MSKFNVGDKVICIHEQMAGTDTVEVGTTGVVTHICEANNSISVNNLMGYSGLPVFSPTAFELLEAAPKKQKKWLKATEARIAELKVGDKVKLSSAENATVLTNEKLGNAPIKLSNGGWYCVTGVLCGRVNSGIDIVKIRNKEYVKENADKSS